MKRITLLLLVLLVLSPLNSQDHTAEWKHFPEGIGLTVEYSGYYLAPDSVLFYADNEMFGAGYWTGEKYETFWNNPESGVYYVKADMYVTKYNQPEIIESPGIHLTYQEPEDTLGRVFRTGEFVPELVVLQEPEHEATNVALNITLIWNETGYADHYQIQFAEGDARNDPMVFGNPIYDEVIDSTEFAIQGLKQNTWYSWRVRAGNHVGWGEWSGNF